MGLMPKGRVRHIEWRSWDWTKEVGKAGGDRGSSVTPYSQ